MVDVGNHEYDHVSGGDEDPSGASGTGFHPSWGNYGDDSLGECGRPFFERFHMPENTGLIFCFPPSEDLIHSNRYREPFSVVL